MKGRKSMLIILLWLPQTLLCGQQAEQDVEREGWDRTRQIMDCAPRMVEQQQLVEDNFDHSYITNNPRDIEVGYFSVEPITYMEKGNRFCEALLPASGVSHTYFRASYETTYSLPGRGVYMLELSSRAMVFNNDLRIINSQNTIAAIEASHRLEVHGDDQVFFVDNDASTFVENQAYTWELEILEDGSWNGELEAGKAIEMSDAEIPAGYSQLKLIKKVQGPGTLSIRESVIFRVNSVSAFKYDPIFQAVCLFNFEALGICTHLLPCEN